MLAICSGSVKIEFQGLKRVLGTLPILDCRASRVLIPLTLLFAIGCGESAVETFEVSGVVTYGGKMVPTGHVVFMPQGPGKSASGAIGSDGRYQLQAPAGLCKVIVIALREEPVKKVDKDNWTEAFDAKSPPPYVPSFYGDPETSPISYTVEPVDKNVFDITIEARQQRRR